MSRQEKVEGKYYQLYSTSCRKSTGGLKKLYPCLASQNLLVHLIFSDDRFVVNYFYTGYDMKKQ